MTTVSVLIPQYGRTAFTARAVRAVRRSRGDLDIAVHVHDNASADGPGEVAERTDVVMTRSDENIGFGPAMNAMAEAASGEFLLLLNNDTIVHPDAIARMVATAAAGDSPVVPWYRDFEGRSLELGGGLGRGATPWQLFKWQEPPVGLTTTTHRADYGSAAAMLVRRTVFLGEGGFDDSYAPAYYEDTDLCMRLAARGIPVVVEPRALVFHYEGGTAGTDVAVGLKTFQVRNRTTFVDRWAAALEDHGDVGLNRAVAAATAPSPGQPRILWLGGVLPRGDRDGGGRRTIEMLTGLRREGAGIAFHARSCHDPDRHGAVLSALGIPWFGRPGPTRWPGDARSTSTFDDLAELLSAADWDVVVPFSARLARKVEPAVRRLAPGAAVVVDNGDLHYLRHERGREVGITIADPQTKDEELDSYASADGVITASDVEDEVLHGEITGLATHVFTVAPPTPRPVPAALHGDVMFLGNLEHPPNTDAVDFWVQSIAPLVAAEIGSTVPLRVVGAGTDAIEASPELDVAGWVPDLATEFARTRVFIAPLRYGAGTKGKLVEAMAHGVPVVTTTIGAEGFPARVTGAMHVADDAAGLAALTVALLEDDAAYAAARRDVIEAAEWFHENHEAAGARLAGWLMSRAYAVRQGEPRPSRRTTPEDEPRPAWMAEKTVPDRPFDPSTFPRSTATTDAPVFVIGAPRSGTSMMAHALAQHPALWIGEESDFLAPLVTHAREAWETGRTRGDLHWLSAAGVTWEEFAAWLGLGMNAMYTDRAGGLRWVEQTPQYTLQLPLIADLFPGARFVYMLRDGRAVVHSLRHFVRPVPHEQASRLWARHVRAGLDFASSARGERIHVVDYRRAVTDTEAELGRIFAFLGLDASPDAVSFIADRDPINSSFAAESSATKAAPRWGTWSVEEREQFQAAAGELLVACGFEHDAGWVTSGT